MSTTRVIGPLPPNTPAGIERPGRQPRRLPDDLLREASRRLGILSLVIGMLWLGVHVVEHLAMYAMVRGTDQWRQWNAEETVASAAIVVSLALYFYSRKSTRSPQFILDLGLVYLVLMCLAIAMLMHWAPQPREYHLASMVSWVGAIVLMFPAIVPTAPRKMLFAGLLAVSMNPFAMLLQRARGDWDFGPSIIVLVMHYPDFLLAGVAVVISHVVTGLGQKVQKAREMGSYQLGELLGSGGMGQVYRATHRMLARPAAIKLIRPETIGVGEGAAAQLAVKRFHREAQAAASLRSPHTVELYDFGVTEDETFYFVMELLDGMNLESLVRQKGPLPARRVIYILRQVCESLEEAHVRGLVHRDIKPANIHVGRLGLRHDFVKVLDFGLVKSLSDVSDDHSLATAAGLTPGTPAYMAPEMARGERLDGRADLYALGCVAYYLLTGQLVFEASSGLQMITKHLQDKPVPPSERAELRVPPALDSLVLACLAKSPDDRPRTAGDLARSLDGIPVDPWSEEHAMQWWSLNQPA